MTAMRAVELPEAPAAEVPAIAAAAQPGEHAVRPGRPPAGPVPASRRPCGRQAHWPAAPRSAGPLTAEFQAAGAHVTGTAPGGQAASVPLRLTRRGRIVVAVTTVLLLAVLSLVVAMSAEATSQAPARPRRASPGDRPHRARACGRSRRTPIPTRIPGWLSSRSQSSTG